MPGAVEIDRGIHQVMSGQAAIDPAVQHHLLQAIVNSPAKKEAGAVTQLPDGLTAREAEVLSLIAKGLTNGEIAERLFVNESTVKSHINHLCAKIGAHDRAYAVNYAYQHGLTEPTDEV
jgi:DNA-binding NarL/FixJ family response regulator